MTGDGPVRIVAPRAPAIPLVFDSPHSGRIYPDDFGFAAPMAVMRLLEDSYVDELFAGAPDHGATLIAATFPRTYIDPNRTLDGLDPDLVDDPWPDRTASTSTDLGLIRRTIGVDRIPVYDRRLSAAEVRRRIEGYWRPYHDALRRRLDTLYEAFGAVWHVNCHAMNSTWGAGYPRAGERIPHDAIIGTRDGTTCERGFMEVVRDTLSEAGLKVAVDDTMKGVALVRLYSDPPRGRHSLQIEINRRLYADEGDFTPTEDFPAVRRTVDRLVAALAGYVRDRLVAAGRRPAAGQAVRGAR